MHFLRRLLIYIASAALVLPVGAIATFDMLWLKPRIEATKELAKNGAPEERNPPELITEMVLASEPRGINALVSRIIITQSTPYFEPRSMLRWHLVGAITPYLLKLHLSEEELLSIYCSRVFVGSRSFGLASIAQKLFNKELSKLNNTEAATVAAWPTAPNLFSKNQAALAKHRDRILNRLGGGI
ncbi:transglycosylase domain-containing protein [Aquipseudomonas campi]|uniref:Transglycosylase domain-containing protein n=1 Tax=Aquipseudomonas campi TaxID=2731681 RepID=A0A6M8FTE9_9GAMM|nr:transglycosylase domain-containing protein [Pseudomonas campi]QKE63306.1 transglycosylase domain-containing protein [Pseudomonas campi]